MSSSMAMLADAKWMLLKGTYQYLWESEEEALG
jgi:hypothetical protein